MTLRLLLQVGGRHPSLHVTHLHIPPASGVLGNDRYFFSPLEAQTVANFCSIELGNSHVDLFYRSRDDLINRLWSVFISWGEGRRGGIALRVLSRFGNGKAFLQVSFLSEKNCKERRRRRNLLITVTQTA